MKPVRGLLLAAATLAACGEASLPSAAVSTPPVTTARCAPAPVLEKSEHWVTSWRTAPSDALITHPLTRVTVRQALAPHRSGEVLRLRLSNRYAQWPVTLENLHVAQEATRGEPAVVPGSACALTFGGQPRVTIPAGESVLSDAIHYSVRAFERLSLSFFAPLPTLQLTRHLIANETLYISTPGDYTADPSGSAFVPMPLSYVSNALLVEALEVPAPRRVTTLVAVGDSLTDGSDATTGFLQGLGSAMNARDARYPNHLQRRIDAAGLPLTVANTGIGGNELLSAGQLPQFGPPLLQRLEADVLSVTAASHVLALIGTNDIGNALPGQLPPVDALIAGYTELIARVQAAGLKIVLGTIPPAEGTVTAGLPIPGADALPVGVQHGTAEARERRDAVNHWIRSQRLSNGIVDFDRCLADPNRPGWLAPAYNSGDHLHPNPAGYEAMAACVDLELFR